MCLKPSGNSDPSWPWARHRAGLQGDSCGQIQLPRAPLHHMGRAYYGFHFMEGKTKA